MTRWNEKDIQDYLKRTGKKPGDATNATPDKRKPNSIKRHKFGAVPTKRHGREVDSTNEARHIDRLDDLKRDGKVLFYLRQVPFDLMNGEVQYICDMQVFWSCGAITFEDPKGYPTPDFKLKMKIMQQEYPHVCVELIDTKGRRWPATRTMREVRQIPECLLDDPSVLNKAPPKNKAAQAEADARELIKRSQNRTKRN